MPQGPRRHTTTRWRAMRWLADHEQDIGSVMYRRKPSAKAVASLISRGLAHRVPTSISYLHKIVLTEKGQSELLTKHKHVNGHVQPPRSREALLRRNKSRGHLAGTDQGSEAPATSAQSPR